MAIKEFKTTKDIEVSKNIIDQVIGQEDGSPIIKKAAQQRRHVLLIGEPGTGKSMLGLALAELLPKSELKDILCLPNANDDNYPLIKEVEAGKGREEVNRTQFDSKQLKKNNNFLMLIVFLAMLAAPWFTWSYYSKFGTIEASIMTASSLIVGMLVLVGVSMMINMGQRFIKPEKSISAKVIVDNFGKNQAPFFDATGAHAGALLGDVLHDPFQSGGLGTPANQRVIAGMIHKAHLGVLFIDEIGTLDPRTQHELLSAMQEKKFPITGQSERSAGAMVRTEPVPCDFVMVAAGNVESIKNMHPALRSRI